MRSAEARRFPPGARGRSGRPRALGAALAVAVVAAGVTLLVMPREEPTTRASDGDRAAPTPAATEPSPAPAVATDPAGSGAAGAGCEFWVSPDGDDSAPGTQQRPWATLEHAAEAVPDRGCTVWFEDGVYRGFTEFERHLDRKAVFRAVHPYRAIFEGSGYVLDVSDSSGVVFRGLRFRHSGPGAEGIVVYVGGSDTHHITFRDVIFHDSYDNDVLKILDGAGRIKVRGSLFYNQGDGEQLIDVNSVTNVTISDCIFFNDFAASGRRNTRSTKAFIVVKDSNGTDDENVGSEGITITRNVFLHWQGGLEALLTIGNDGKPYHEATDVEISNNLIVGDGSDAMYTPLAIHGAENVTFANNTVVGDLPTSSFAFIVGTKGANPRNDRIWFWNNIWADPTGTMDEFSDGERAQTERMDLDRNLYWNDGSRVPGGDLLSPRDDARAVLGDPGLRGDQDDVVLPTWDGSFESGSATIREEFVRLVGLYGAIASSGAAVDAAVASRAPNVDILGNRRDDRPDLGAYEA